MPGAFRPFPNTSSQRGASRFYRDFNYGLLFLMRKVEEVDLGMKLSHPLTILRCEDSDNDSSESLVTN
jgi:hypothetical protein